VVDLDAPAEENIVNLAKAKGVKPEALTAMILDRPRHADLIGAVRKAGAAVSLISDGDVAGVPRLVLDTEGKRERYQRSTP
jgi:fructose-1,6-bisphosphatase II / sedoheptulose-1,7-bisphosphatase